MINRDYLPTLFVELQKMCDPHSFLNDYQMTRDELAGLSLYETDDQIILDAPVPGVKPDQIQVTVEKGVVWIKAEAAEEKKDAKAHFKTERTYSYRVPLPMRIDEHVAPEAVCKDGIVTITLPKSRACKPIKVSVK